MEQAKLSSIHPSIHPFESSGFCRYLLQLAEERYGPKEKKMRMWLSNSRVH